MLLMPNAPVTSRLAMVADVAGRGLEYSNSRCTFAHSSRVPFTYLYGKRAEAIRRAVFRDSFVACANGRIFTRLLFIARASIAAKVR